MAPTIVSGYAAWPGSWPTSPNGRQSRSVRPSARRASTTALTSCARSRDDHEQRVRGVDDHHVVEADQRHDPARGRDDDPGRRRPPAGAASPRTRSPAYRRRRAAAHPATRSPPRRPTRTPPGTTATRPCGRGGLGDGVVDGDLLQPGPDVVEGDGSAASARRPAASPGCHCASRSSSTRRPHDEHPRVPPEPAGREVLLGPRPVRLLDELRHRVRRTRRPAPPPSST